MPIVASPAAIEKDKAFELIGGHPALDLVNTLDWRFRDGDAEELLESYADVLRFAEQSGLLKRPQVRQLSSIVSAAQAIRILALTRQLREAAAEVFYASIEARMVSPSILNTLERFFKTARQHQQFSRCGSGLGWVWPRGDAAPELAFWILCLSVEALMTSAELQRVRACGNFECRWLFPDTSKNHTRRWCNMKICGNRMKARRFKAQHRI
jgi:predicted RNA-binding Zn ribbon-like protein